MQFRPLAEIKSQRDLLQAFRARAQELRVSRLTLDDLANLPDGFAGKVLGPGQVRRITIDTLWRLLAGTGTKLLLVEDPESMDQIKPMLTPRDERLVRHRHAASP
jgi:hypothetical protein